MKVSRCLSTQHPDNVTLPFFAENSVLGGEDEIQEAFYHYSHLDIHEQMWDSEGKEVDSFVVKKLLAKYPHFFEKNKLGKDFFLTLRVPNPSIERDEAKILLETLESIPRSFDTARKFYNDDTAPIFEVILPMASSSKELEFIYQYYKDHVTGKKDKIIAGRKIKDWIGDFQPEHINVIPLLEDKKSMLSAKSIVGDYVSGKQMEYQRVFLARSDPALNYGWLSAVLMNKIALCDLHELEEEISIPILPIIGVGSAPFRGNFSPRNINCLHGYPSVQTFTIQSAFKYDFPHNEVKKAIDKINGTKISRPFYAGKEILPLVEKYSEAYTQQLGIVVPWIHEISAFVPKRRRRKLHTGLFGYSRASGKAKLPRAISFCASLYSLGIPPEILGFDSVTGKDMEYLEEVYRNFDMDLKAALPYTNLGNIEKVSEKLAATARRALKMFDIETQKEHEMITSDIMHQLGKNIDPTENILKAAWIRRFLG